MELRAELCFESEKDIFVLSDHKKKNSHSEEEEEEEVDSELGKRQRNGGAGVGTNGRATVSSAFRFLFKSGVRQGSARDFPTDDVPAFAVAVSEPRDQPPHPRLLRHLRPRSPLLYRSRTSLSLSFDSVISYIFIIMCFNFYSLTTSMKIENGSSYSLF